MPDELTGSEIKFSLAIGAPDATSGIRPMVVINEKLTSDLAINTNEIQVEATFDAGGWADFLAGQMDGAIPLTMYMRKGSAVHKAVRDAVLGQEVLGFEWDSPNETLTGDCALFGWNVTNTSTNNVVQVNTNIRLKGEPTVVDKP